MLTGKCKEDFEKWLCYNYSEFDFYNIMNWNEHIFSMQFGVYVDFFDSVGIDIEIALAEHDGVNYGVFVNNIFSADEKTRTEARQKAIEKANEIYNEL